MSVVALGLCFIVLWKHFNWRGDHVGGADNMVTSHASNFSLRVVAADTTCIISLIVALVELILLLHK